METWIQDRLSACLGFDVPDDLIRYINAINNEKDLQAYLKTLLDFNNPEHRSFAADLLKEKGNSSASSAKGKGKKEIKKTIESPDKAAELGKKKSKFVNLYSQEGQSRDIVLLKGRHHCDCQASKHGLINNCLKCGRIVCQQEGSGPCLFCGELVCSPEEQQLLTVTTKKSTALYNKLMEQKRPQGWEAALAQRNKLLEYDRTSESRTRVMDDDNDYFSNNSVWLNKSEREKLTKYEKELNEKKHASRLQQKVTLDFAGRQILEEQNFESEGNEEIIKQMMKKATISKPTESTVEPGVDIVHSNVHPDIEFIPEYEYSITKRNEDRRPVQKAVSNILRVQDEGLQLISDAGKCLSMHQPWASLLVEGIKIHEGRTWYTSHRGRLWIASTSQQPDNDTVRSVENMYNVLYKDTIKFPDNYPPGCLLGCITVGDCLPQEEYRARFPEGESDSPYVLICSNPISLPLRFPVKGKHKIYALEPKIHEAAVKMIQTKAKIEYND